MPVILPTQSDDAEGWYINGVYVRRIEVNSGDVIWELPDDALTPVSIPDSLIFNGFDADNVDQTYEIRYDATIELTEVVVPPFLDIISVTDPVVDGLLKIRQITVNTNRNNDTTEDQALISNNFNNMSGLTTSVTWLGVPELISASYPSGSTVGPAGGNITVRITGESGAEYTVQTPLEDFTTSVTPTTGTIPGTVGDGNTGTVDHVIVIPSQTGDARVITGPTFINDHDATDTVTAGDISQSDANFPVADLAIVAQEPAFLNTTTGNRTEPLKGTSISLNGTVTSGTAPYTHSIYQGTDNTGTLLADTTTITASIDGTPSTFAHFDVPQSVLDEIFGTNPAPVNNTTTVSGQVVISDGPTGAQISVDAIYNSGGDGHRLRIATSNFTTAPTSSDDPYTISYTEPGNTITPSGLSTSVDIDGSAVTYFYEVTDSDSPTPDVGTDSATSTPQNPTYIFLSQSDGSRNLIATWRANAVFSFFESDAAEANLSLSSSSGHTFSAIDGTGTPTDPYRVTVSNISVNDSVSNITINNTITYNTAALTTALTSNMPIIQIARPQINSCVITSSAEIPGLNGSTSTAAMVRVVHDTSRTIAVVESTTDDTIISDVGTTNSVVTATTADVTAVNNAGDDINTLLVSEDLVDTAIFTFVSPAVNNDTISDDTDSTVQFSDGFLTGGASSPALPTSAISTSLADNGIFGDITVTATHTGTFVSNLSSTTAGQGLVFDINTTSSRASMTPDIYNHHVISTSATNTNVTLVSIAKREFPQFLRIRSFRENEAGIVYSTVSSLITIPAATTYTS